MLSNNDVKYYASLKQKKYRETENKFLIEGFHLIEECLSSPYAIECIIASDKTGKNTYGKIAEHANKKKIPFYNLKDTQFSKLIETKKSQGITAVVQKQQTVPLSGLYKSRLVIALDKINDPGNLGTIIRTAYWFGADAVITGVNSVDIYNSKVLRSSQGAVFHINLYENIKPEKFLSELNEKGFSIYLLDVKGNQTLSDIPSNSKTVFVFGNESEGISDEIVKMGYSRLKIEGYSGCESLNVAVSCGIVLYEYSKAGKS